MSKDNPHGGIGKGAPGRKRSWSGPGRNRTSVRPAETEYAVKQLLDEAARYLAPDQPPVRAPSIVVARRLCATVEWQQERIAELERGQIELVADRAAYARLVEDWNRICAALEAIGAAVSMPLGSERWQWEYKGKQGEADTAGEAVAAVLNEIAT